MINKDLMCYLRIAIQFIQLYMYRQQLRVGNIANK